MRDIDVSINRNSLVSFFLLFGRIVQRKNLHWNFLTHLLFVNAVPLRSEFKGCNCIRFSRGNRKVMEGETLGGQFWLICWLKLMIASSLSVAIRRSPSRAFITLSERDLQNFPTLRFTATASGIAPLHGTTGSVRLDFHCLIEYLHPYSFLYLLVLFLCSHASWGEYHIHLRHSGT